MNTIKFLHIIKDDKFFDDVFLQFEQIPNFENNALLLVKNTHRYQFTHIKLKDKVRLVESKDLIQILKEGRYDFVFFYSLPVRFYKYVTRIPNNKKIIWWCWGYEIYSPIRGLDPLVAVPLYKPLTQRFIVKNNPVKVFLMRVLLAPYYSRIQQKVICRIDYFQPVLPYEYRLMLGISGFRAKEFYYPGHSLYTNVDIPYDKRVDGGILVGNSATPSNNHLDIWSCIERFIPSNRKVVVPVNYPKGKLADKIDKYIRSDRHNLFFLRDFLPREKYFELIDSCSYAVFGVIRQQAMGNIYYCLLRGIKVFLYRESIVYKFMKEYGFVVYAIEDIDESSFINPLSITETKKNTLAFAKISSYIESVRRDRFKEFLESSEK